MTSRKAFAGWNILLCIIFSACMPASAQQLRELSGPAQGTYFIVKYVSDDTSDLRPQIDSIFNVIDNSLSLYKPGSLINRFNEQTSVEMDEHMANVVRRAIEISKATKGAFDITVKPLVDAWGFGVHKPAVRTVPAADTLQRILRYVGHRYLKVQGTTLIKTKKEVQIDCNGIAQGYTTDVIAHFLQQKGIADYLVDVGGELAASGKNQRGKIWTVGIETPSAQIQDAPAQALLELDNRAITTSGNYRRFFEQGGTHFAHSIDPATGEALHSNIIAVTVMAKNAITADGYDNALILMGVDKGLEFIRKHPAYGLEAYFIYKDETGKITVAFSKGYKNMILLK
ncbi:FAD:protein FMN transferase [Chitinophaga pinensis]|uniref:FAD:protein FMN transferase n=1 Tax=Chitinophaga pinensis (strain ATCC 43595 / DSM 2588 / LMG 13176 / NBRC 15968 / NCIMB 11800 / UQM 2034) TaxID=485918 RepID=A0A979G2Z8_CHIPD|nr:FAD:protein FMN transferase [Chitinophaga pinensis]ACU59723.1 ApbE family lipoprotein [Chitinophaga pinensis DSM 2588]